ncbi:MAG: tyrosine-protein phosphatase [Oscillospiraceae bacterium]|nr:tyrosine-protein phosphatase [Oscillospiraceae bacterium]
MKHSLDLVGISNAREPGGYVIGDKYVKKGILLRTGSLAGASPDVLKKLREEYHVRTVVDFRMSDERQSSPDPEIEGVKNIHLPVIEMEDYPVTDPKLYDEYVKSGRDRMKLFEMSYESGALNPQMYVGFLLGERGKSAYREFFRVLLESDEGAVLWHCTDGKDRTGCAAMLLLSALGASRETIIQDYMLTNEYNAVQIEAVRSKFSAYQMPPEKLEALLFMCGAVVKRYMTNAIDTLNEKYGSVEAYLREELNIGKGEIEELKHNYLCEARI